MILYSGGCATHKSICRDKDEIERLDKEIKNLRKTYDEKYLENKKAYVALTLRSQDNGYIMFYVNETIQAVHTLENYLDLINKTLQIEHDELFKRFEANPNSTLYLASLIGELEYSLSDLKKMIDATKYGQIMGLAMKYLIQFTLNRFVQGYDKAYDKVALPEDVKSSSLMTALFSADAADAKILLDADHPDHNKVMKKHGVPTADQIELKTKFTLVPKVLKQMGSDMIDGATNFGTGIKKLAESKDLEFKGRMSKYTDNFLKGIESRRLKVQMFFEDKSFRKLFVKNFKLEWSVKGMMGLGAIMDGVTMFLDMKNWAKVASELRKARKRYTTYRNNLKRELATITTQTKELVDGWPEVIETFKNLSLSFKSLVDDATKYEEFSDVLGLPKLPVDANSPLFSLDFNTITKSNLRQAQAVVIGFIKEADNDMIRVADQLKARTILYENVQKMTAAGKSVQHMLSSFHDIYRFSSSETVRDFGELLKRKDLVCTVSQLKKTKTVYDFFQLEPFRPRCAVTPAKFQEITTNAIAARQASAAVGWALRTCAMFKFCPCPAAIARVNGITRAVVIDLIKSLRPEWREYCGTTDCECVVL